MCTTISTLNMPREEWLQLRKSGIGGSDAGAICGLNPYASPMSVYRDKTTEDLSDMDSETMRQGRDLEDYVARRFMEATGLKVRRSNMMYRSEEHPFMIADVDRLIVGEDAGLECKTASAYNADKWKDGEVPLHYLMQCCHYMAVTGRSAWYIAVLIYGLGKISSVRKTPPPDGAFPGSGVPPPPDGGSFSSSSPLSRSTVSPYVLPPSTDTGNLNRMLLTCLPSGRGCG